MKYLRKLQNHMNPPVWYGSAGMIIAFLLYGTLATNHARESFSVVHQWIVIHFGWFFVLTAAGALFLVLFLMVSPFGAIRLGSPDSKPEFSPFAWFTMVFAAGMGTGLVFFGVVEPMQHVLSPPPRTLVDSGARSNALMYSFFHWGLHPWAIYVLVGLSLSYFHFRRGLPLAPRSMLYPLIGNRIYGPIGHGTDILCTVGTLFGVATSLGFGAQQINAGLSQISDLEFSITTQVALITIITGFATTSVLLGLHSGISVLSRINMVLAIALLLFVFVMGPTLSIVENMVSSTGVYLQHLLETSFFIRPGETSQWQRDYTLFYWSWWISWSPFVGVFTARISRGRTVREYIAGVLLVPTAAVILWMSVFGVAGLEAYNGGLDELATVVADKPALALHTLLRAYPVTSGMSVLTTLLITIFFITSSDSGSLVDDMVTSGGNPDPPRALRLFWALAEGGVAITLLMAGGLSALRTASLSSGLPMAVLLVFAGWALYRGLRSDESKGHSTT
ncbi:MAG: choline transporter [Spirochaetaceae bacterium]|nr:choline transporter [Spirochaetaceae bacterium]|tara:strand:- start:316211 stop:317728 length:1518 start_codon:yes stop_codon:yes gene_type:complete